MRGSFRRITLPSGVLLLALGACAAHHELFNTHRVLTQHEAGSVQFAVVSVAPWREYMDALQPRFELTEEAALQEVVPTTRLMQDSVIDAMQATLGVATPQRRKTTQEVQVKGSDQGASVGNTGISGSAPPTDVNVSHVSVDAGAGNTKVTTKTEEQAPALATPASVPSAKPLDQRAAAPVRPAHSPEPSVDPMTRYWAATALFQEVQLLNRYVRDASVRTGFRPYVVRLQVSLMPAARNEPYDAYCTCSFFTATEGAGAQLTALRTTDPEHVTPASKRGTPQIIPLMVTDNLEAGLQARMLDTMRQLAGAIYLMSASPGGGAVGDVQKLDEQLQSVFGQDLNSLLTVGRISDNTVRVRLGAMQQGSVNHAMVPRNHNVTLLLLVPEDAPDTVQVVARTTMVDAETGLELPERTPAEVMAALRESAAKNGLDAMSDEKLHELLGCAQRNDQNAFFSALHAQFGNDDPRVARAGTLWVDLVSLMIGGQYGSSEFDLPTRSREHASNRPPILVDQTVLVEDDGKSLCTAVLHGVAIDSSSEVDAVLTLTHEDRTLRFVAVDATLNHESGDMTLHFPSLAASGLATSANVFGKLHMLVKHNGKPLDFDAIYRAASGN